MIVIFAKAPVPGRAKTRLIPALGAEGAAALAAEMLATTIAEARAADLGPVELCADPDPNHADWQGLLPSGIRLSGQGAGDLGARLARATQRAIARGGRVLLIGTDCPQLDRDRLRSAARTLEDQDAVILPAEDGGYVLLGLKRFHPCVFADIAWSSPEVGAATLARVQALGWSVHVGAALRDVDEPGDLCCLL